MGYEDDGVEGFICLECKGHISIRGAWGNPIAFCPYCGVEFLGAWIKDGSEKRNQLRYQAKQKDFKKYWQLQTLELSYHSDGTPFGENWKNDAEIYNGNRVELLQKQREKIKAFLEFPAKHLWGGKTEFKTRLVYIKYEPNEKNTYGRYGKETILATIKETCDARYTEVEE